MKQILFLLFIASILFLGCDGKERVHLSNTQVLKEHKLLDSFAENVKYIPEKYTEIETDTLLSNGYRVKIKTFTDLENSVLQSFKVDSIINKHYFREIIFDIEVFKNDELIFKEELNNEFFSKNLNYVNNEIYIDELKTLETNTLYLVASQCIPRTVNCPEYYLIIDESGSFKVFENKSEPDSSFN